jgi:hypothetical protein
VNGRSAPSPDGPRSNLTKSLCATRRDSGVDHNSNIEGPWAG